jgi:hypothetical protein
MGLINNFLNDPATILSTNLLAAGGPSLQPQSFGQGLQQALQGTQQQLSTMERLEQQKALIDAQIQNLGSRTTLNRANTIRALTPEATEESNPFAKINPSDFTPESLAQFQATRDFSVLVPKDKKEKTAAATKVGKINQDLANGNITADTANTLKQAALSEDQRSVGEAEGKLRSEFFRFNRGPASALTSLVNAKNLLIEGNPTSAQAAFTAFIKAIDDSVVRPSETEAFSNARGAVRDLQTSFNKFIGGGPLTEKDRKELNASVDALAKGLSELQSRNIEFYNKLASEQGLNPQNITGLTITPKFTPGSVDPQIFEFGGQQYRVGDVVTNSQGERARVEADGSLTRL